ncbi:HsdR family type I site-specific deoxyribonuclease [Streptomyces jumonjinensis]|uniref:Type I restriction enzyme endonuclease subunit n=1 Tax=Streptomyces jumonjinensis TaxID=1945 RepID=A0A646KEJ1_STRJU|nr:HsdR family type I site-specific deoxyribonuclease [Streptomyces jumonjinensis]
MSGPAAGCPGPGRYGRSSGAVLPLCLRRWPLSLGDALRAERFEKVRLIDWENPEANHFALAEEVTVTGRHTKRPDVVLYVNGIALATLELKRSKVAVSEGIRQTIGNQRPEFIRSFFTTVQLVLAGNDVEGLRYGVVGTPEKYWLAWREESDVAAPLDRALTQLCAKRRLLELIHDFMVFDAGVKKTCRHNQYFGVKAAQERIARREGGIIWHTQGSGKSLTMVWLAKWIRENQTDARVLLITDRTELDEQIERVFARGGEKIYRTRSGADLLAALNASDRWLICSLVHKFRSPAEEKAGDGAENDFVRELTTRVPADFRAKGNVFVFVDEAHRTQSGSMHDAVKRLLPDAVFIGFTGTPLLKTEKTTTIEKFGDFIHTYRFDEAVADGVVLDLRYEARAVDQELTSPEKIDAWFAAKTRGMTDRSRAELKKRWATLRKVASAEPRARQIVDDILLDMETRPRLMDQRGNALLIASGIYEACIFYELFRDAGFAEQCAVVTSYTPRAADISKEDSGQGATEKLRQYEIYRRMLADHFGEPADTAITKVEQFEKEVKERFVRDPGRMRLLIVVDKLLTGFDAPSATYLYIDRTMRDHGLFQAICRVNRLDGDDKDYGYIVDYRDLFNSLETALADYTTDALDAYDRGDVEGLLADRIDRARDDLETALKAVRELCAGVEPPRNTLQYQRYFCAREQGDAGELKANEPQRVELCKAVAAVARAYGALANEMPAAGYGEAEAAAIKAEIVHYAHVRDEVLLGAGESVDFKQYEAGMRRLLDAYVGAKPSKTVAEFQDAGLIELVVRLGAGAIDRLPEGIRADPEAVAATLANTLRKVIVDERPLNPKYYGSMSRLLDEVLEEGRRGAVGYQRHLAALLELARKLGAGESGTAYPAWADNGARRALIDFFQPSTELAVTADTTVRQTKPDSWVGNPLKEKKVRHALAQALPQDFERLDELVQLVKARQEYR